MESAPDSGIVAARRPFACAVVASVVLTGGLVGPAVGDDPAPLPVSQTRSATAARCPDPGIVDVHFPTATAVDEVRVVFAKPGRGAARAEPVTLSIAAGRWLRRLPVAPSSGQGLRFSPALTGEHFQVRLDSGAEPGDQACVRRVLLLTKGTVVATIAP
jgi:hypothetical protein